MVYSGVAHVVHAWRLVHGLVDVSRIHRLPVLLGHLRNFRSSFVSVGEFRNRLLVIKCCSLLNDRIVSGDRATAAAFRTNACFAAVYDLILKELREMAILFAAVILASADVGRILNPATLSAHKG